jgi:MOB kinase activator 1
MGRGQRHPSPNPIPQYQRRSPATPTTPSSAASVYSVNSEQLENLSLNDGDRPKPLYLCNPFVKAALVKGNFKTIVAQPRYCDLNEVCDSVLAAYYFLIPPVDSSG